jgi:multicomponent Na+:H+ antiporter subunit E
MLSPPRLGGTAATARAAITRAIGFLAVWILIGGTYPTDFPAGLVAAALASWASLVLHPPSARRLKFGPLMRLGSRLLFDSVVAGFDVARRALDPRLPLNPGSIRYVSGFPPGSARAVFGTIMSLVPGTLPLGPAADGTLLVHCLDLDQPIAANLAQDEAALRAALGEVPISG